MKKNNFISTINQLRSFIILFTGQSVSQFGTSMTSFAIIIWVYTQQNSVMATSLLAICGAVPYIIVSVFGGAITDRASKKAIMLICDSIAAIGSLIILLCFLSCILQVWHLCIINAINSFMNAFQGPASEVAVTLTVPKQHYVRVGGIQGVIRSLLSVLVPAIAAGILAFGGLGAILLIDLGTFIFAFLTLLCFVKIPKTNNEVKKQSIAVIKADIKSGVAFLKTQKGILYLSIFWGVINFVAAISFNSLLSPMILARTSNNEITLGIISSAMALAGVISGLLVSVMKPAKNKVRVMFWGIKLAFLFSIMLFGMGQNVYWWGITFFIGMLGMPFYFTYEGAILREAVPVEMQGRVFSVKGMISQVLMPVGYFLGALLADNVFEPFMEGNGATQDFFKKIVGSGSGSGMALMFVITGLIGLIVCFILQKNKHIKALNNLSVPYEEKS